MSSYEEYFQIFNIEAKKLESLVNAASTKPGLPLSEIVQVYYQTMNVKSMSVMLREQFGNSDERNPLISEVDKIHEFISENFDSNLHCLIMTQLARSISDIMKNLESSNIAEQSKDEIESKAKLYEKLRETMSTKEFVEQYDKGLSDD